jgi:hypothetical protein
VEACGNEEEAGVQTAIATVSLSGTLNEKLEAIAKAQFRGVEIFENACRQVCFVPVASGRGGCAL